MTIKSFFQKIFSPIVVGNCLGMVVVTALLIFGTLQFLQCYTDHGEAVVVPNIRGMKTDVAESKMKALGLRLEVKDTGYVDSYVGNVVLEQRLHQCQCAACHRPARRGRQYLAPSGGKPSARHGLHRHPHRDHRGRQGLGV